MTDVRLSPMRGVRLVYTLEERHIVAHAIGLRIGLQEEERCNSCILGARSQHVRLEQVYLGSSCVDLTTVSHPPRRGQLPTALSHTSTLIECRSKTSHSIEKYRGITCIKPMRVTKQLMPARAWGSQSHHLVDASTVASTVASTIRGCRIGGCSTIASAIGGCSIRGSIRGGGGRI